MTRYLSSRDWALERDETPPGGREPINRSADKLTPPPDHILFYSVFGGFCFVLFCLSMCSLVLYVSFVVPDDLGGNGWRGCRRGGVNSHTRRGLVIQGGLRVCAFPSPAIPYSDKSKLKVKEFILAYCFRFQSIMAGESRHQEPEAGDNSMPLARRVLSRYVCCQAGTLNWQAQVPHDGSSQSRQFLMGICRGSLPRWL